MDWWAPKTGPDAPAPARTRTATVAELRLEVREQADEARSWLDPDDTDGRTALRRLQDAADTLADRLEAAQKATRLPLFVMDSPAGTPALYGAVGNLDEYVCIGLRGEIGPVVFDAIAARVPRVAVGAPRPATDGLLECSTRPGADEEGPR